MEGLFQKVFLKKEFLEVFLHIIEHICMLNTLCKEEAI